MAKQVILRDPHGKEIPYTIIETIEDFSEVPCHGTPEDLIARFNEGKTIIVNRMGGYCFLVEGYHTIVQ